MLHKSVFAGNINYAILNASVILDKNETSLERNETRGGSLLLSGAVFISVFSISTAKFFFAFFVKFTNHDTLTMVESNLRLPVFELILDGPCTDLLHLCKCHTGMKCGSLCTMECTGGLCSLTMAKYKR